jgi:hypothetical protein
LQNATLVVAKLDRMAGDTQFPLTVVNQSGEKGAVFCDLPTLSEGTILQQMSSAPQAKCVNARFRNRQRKDCRFSFTSACPGNGNC